MRRSGPVALVQGIALAAIAWAVPVAANSPAKVDQIVCSADVVVEATVTAAKGTCEKAGSSIRCSGADNALLLDLRVDRVLTRKVTTATSRSSPGVIAGASLADVYVSGYDQLDGSGSDARTLPFVAPTRDTGVPERRWMEVASTSDDAAHVGNLELKGRPFVFAFSSPRFASERGFARMWTIDRETDLLGLVKATSWPGCSTVVESIR